MIQDIIKGDSSANENKIIKYSYNLSQQNNTYKDSIISDKNKIIQLSENKNKDLINIISFKDEQLLKESSLSKTLTKEYKKEKRNNIFTKIISSVAIGVLGYLYITK